VGADATEGRLCGLGGDCPCRSLTLSGAHRDGAPVGLSSVVLLTVLVLTQRKSKGGETGPKYVRTPVRPYRRRSFEVDARGFSYLSPRLQTAIHYVVIEYDALRTQPSELARPVDLSVIRRPVASREKRAGDANGALPDARDEPERVISDV
jgi:hypothetical protein